MATMKKGAAEARAAMSELFAELDRTRKEYAKASLQLTHLETTVQHQRDTDSKKDATLSYLESELRRREETYRADLQVLQEESKTKEATAQHRTRFLELEIARLSQEVEAAQNFEKDNRQLRDAVLECQATIEKLQLVIEELKTRAKEDAREHAAQLEAEFKRRLAESEKKFRAEAYRALSDEAKVALQGNDHLQSVLQRQNDAIEAILLKCKQLEQSHAALTGEQDVAAQNIQHHLSEIQRLKRQLADAGARNTQLEEALQQRKVERASLELLYVEYESTRKQLAKAQDQARRSGRESERWRQRAVQLTQELGSDERPAAEHQLEQIAAQSEKLEHHLQRSRIRAERRDRERERNAGGAAAYRGLAGEEADGGDRWSVLDPNDERCGADGEAEDDDDAHDDDAGQLANPTDILRIWNARFMESEKKSSSAPNDPMGAAGSAAAGGATSSSGLLLESAAMGAQQGGGDALTLASFGPPVLSDTSHQARPCACRPGRKTPSDGSMAYPDGRVRHGQDDEHHPRMQADQGDSRGQRRSVSGVLVGPKGRPYHGVFGSSSSHFTQ
jgi:hypothetical protein